MGTLGGKINLIQLAQERPHFARFESPIGPYDAVASHGGKPFFKVLAQLF